jgi:hypothetical protein
MALFQSVVIVTFLIVMSSNRVKLRFHVFRLPQPNFKNSAGMSSGPIDSFLPIADGRFLIILTLMLKGSPE